MGFFDTLRRVLGGEHGQGEGAGEGGPGAGGAGEDVAAAAGLTDSGADAGPTKPGDLEAGASAYDRANWQKKLKHVLDELPASQTKWPELMAEAKALKLDPDWVTRCQVEEFMLLIRRAVSHRHVTEEEHRKLDLARDLIGIPEAEAEAALHSAVSEAERFFGKPVEGA